MAEIPGLFEEKCLLNNIWKSLPIFEAKALATLCLLCTVMFCTVLCQKNFSTHCKIPGDLLDLVRKSKCISSILPIVMQSENKEADVLCSGSCITNRFGRREVATESLICIICRKRRLQLDSHSSRSLWCWQLGKNP